MAKKELNAAASVLQRLASPRKASSPDAYNIIRDNGKE